MRNVVPEYKFGKNSLRVKHAVNGDMLRPFDNSISHLIPEVSVSKATEQFQAWLSSKYEALN